MPIVACPQPFKVAYTHRGEALRKAVEYRQYPYLCRCGTFHLSSRPNTMFDGPLRMLIEEMMGVSA